MTENAKEEELRTIRRELKEMFVKDLGLDGVDPAKIEDQAPLFGEGLGLDSLDAVEIVVLLQRCYGIEVRNMEQGRAMFTSIDTIARFIQQHRQDRGK